MIMGTVPYTSPEQLKGEVLDHRTDLFSLGIVLYEMATGQRPFKGDKSAEVMSSILRDTPRPLHELSSADASSSGSDHRALSGKEPGRTVPVSQGSTQRVACVAQRSGFGRAARQFGSRRPS